jgi:hypothetical protein
MGSETLFLIFVGTFGLVLTVAGIVGLAMSPKAEPPSDEELSNNLQSALENWNHNYPFVRSL